jgi:hypothetical protein
VRRLCLVVPNALVSKVLDANHNLKTAGHLGIEKTVIRSKGSFMWYHLARNARLVHVTSCSVCKEI